MREKNLSTKKFRLLSVYLVGRDYEKFPSLIKNKARPLTMGRALLLSVRHLT